MPPPHTAGTSSLWGRVLMACRKILGEGNLIYLTCIYMMHLNSCVCRGHRFVAVSHTPPAPVPARCRSSSSEGLQPARQPHCQPPSRPLRHRTRRWWTATNRSPASGGGRRSRLRPWPPQHEWGEQRVDRGAHQHGRDAWYAAVWSRPRCHAPAARSGRRPHHARGNGGGWSAGVVRTLRESAPPRPVPTEPRRHSRVGGSPRAAARPGPPAFALWQP